MAPPCFPLRWESTGDKWWYASPIDWAAANGLYDLVLELLHLDTNLLIELTSVRRIRRLETVWDDDGAAGFGDVAKCRAYVARRLLHECETSGGQNSLIRAGYGGWLLYTAASAGDMGFVKELLERDALLVFGEGEYGVTDIFYAAARSKDSEVFRLLMELAVSWGGGTSEDRDGLFEREVKNRAVHAAASGGNLEVLTEAIGGSDGALSFTDAEGSTALHTAAAAGKIEVKSKNFMKYFD